MTPTHSDIPIDSTPYRGLASYRSEHSDWYFGRTKLTYTVVSRLHQAWIKGTGPVIVVGPSGSGKTSLIAAGVIPALQRDQFGGTDGNEWPVVVITPGTDPVHALAAGLAKACGPGSARDAADIAADLRTAPATAAEYAQQAATSAGADGLLLVIDQLEEIFTETTDESQRWTLLAAARAMSTEARAGGGSGPAGLALFGLRGDFYHRALSDPQLVEVVQRSQVAVGPMTEAEMREAIVEPARRSNLDVEAGLADTILDDLTPSTEGRSALCALPLLSHALFATRQASAVGRMTLSGYRRCGGVHKAIARSADSVIDAMSPADRDLARRILTTLVKAGPDGAYVARRLSRPSLTQSAEGEIAQGRFDAVFHALVENRLIADERGGSQIIHESLVAAWPRLQEWADGRTPSQPERDPATPAAAGPNNRRRTWFSGGIAALCALTLVAVAGGIVALQQRSAAQDESAVAIAQRDAADTARIAAIDDRDAADSRALAGDAGGLLDVDPALARLLSVAAYEIAPTVQARSSLIASSSGPAVSRMLGPGDGVDDFALSPNGELLAGVTRPGDVVLWDVSAPRALPAGELPGLLVAAEAIAFHPSDDLIAVAGEDGAVFLYSVDDPAAPKLVAELAGAEQTVRAIAFAPSGSALAVGGSARTVWMWDLADGVGRASDLQARQLTTKPSGSVTSLSFSPDSSLLAAGAADGTAYRWKAVDSAKPELVGKALTTSSEAVLDVEFSPDSDTLAAANADGNVYRWTLSGKTAKASAPLAGPADRVNDLVYGPGSILAGASSDGQAWVWDADTVTTLPHDSPVRAVTFSADGQSLFTAGDDGVARRWQLNTGRSHDFDVTFVNDVAELVRWSSEGFQPVPVPFADGAGALTDVFAQSADGDLLAISTDSSVHVSVRVDGGDPILATLTDAPTTVDALAANPDGDLLALAAEGAIQLWAIPSAGTPRALGQPVPALADGISSLAFAATGTLAVGGVDGNVQIWDITDLAEPVADLVPSGPADPVVTMAFSPGGGRLAASTADGVWLWEWSGSAEPTMSAVLDGSPSDPAAITFDETGHRLAVVGRDQTTRNWTIDLDVVIDDICRTSGDSITQDEWDRYVPGRDYSPPCT
jgi:WD40 repeat protein